MCHAFDQDAKDGHDLLIGLNSGDGNILTWIWLTSLIGEVKLFKFICSLCIIVVYSVSLRQQLQDVGKKLVGAHHYNKDGSVNNRQDFSYDTHYASFLFLFLFVFTQYDCLYLFLFWMEYWDHGILLKFCGVAWDGFMIMSGLYWVFLFNYCNTCLRVYCWETSKSV